MYVMQRKAVTLHNASSCNLIVISTSKFK